MKTLLLLFVLFFCALSLKAQNYSPIVDGNVSFFTGSDSYIVALKVLSKQELTNKTEYQLNTVWDLSNTQCISTAGISWNGSKCTKEGEVFSFYNKNNEPLKTYPLASINSSWTAYTYANTDILKAKVSKIEKKTFLGVEDNVKTIVFERQTSAGLAVNDVANSATLELSENYGLVKAFDFSTFPTSTSQKILSGTTSPALGKTYLTNKEIYSFEIGDEFHYDFLETDAYGYSSQTNTIKIVLNKTITDTELIYTFDIKQSFDYKYLITNQATYTVIHNTTVEHYSILPDLIVPEEPINGSSYLWKYDSDGRRVLTPSSKFFSKQGDCWREMAVDPMPNYIIKEGLGLVKDDKTFSSYSVKTMVYYKKGTEVWGTPVVVGVEEEKQMAIKIYPNPLNKDGVLSISTHNQRISKVEVFNLCGISVYQLPKVEDTKAVLNLSNLPQGMYLLQITDTNGKTVTQKVVK